MQKTDANIARMFVRDWDGDFFHRVEIDRMFALAHRNIPGPPEFAHKFVISDRLELAAHGLQLNKRKTLCLRRRDSFSRQWFFEFFADLQAFTNGSFDIPICFLDCFSVNNASRDGRCGSDVSPLGVFFIGDIVLRVGFHNLMIAKIDAIVQVL